METYAIVEDGVIVNAVAVDPTLAEPDPTWVRIDNLDPAPWIGWTSTDGGQTWTAPPSP